MRFHRVQGSGSAAGGAQVINLYLSLLKEREARMEGAYPVCHFFNSFFFAKVSRHHALLAL